MIQAQRTKLVVSRYNVSAATNATFLATVDTLGFQYAKIDAYLPAAAATNSSAKWTSLQLTHGTTTDASNHTAVSGAIGTTNSTASATQFVLPANNDTSNPQVVRFYVECPTKERILGIQGESAASLNTTCVIAELFRAEDMPDSDTDRGVDKSVTV